MHLNYCVVNWAFEDEQLLQPYEWQEDDPIEWLFHIEIFKVTSDFIYDCMDAWMEFENLEKGYYLIGDGKRSLVIAVDQNKRLCMRSYIEYTLQRKVNEIVSQLTESYFSYKILDYQISKEYGLTRFEKEKKQVLLAYLDSFDYEELSELSSNNWEYIENGYHLFHEYLYNRIAKQKSKPE